MMKLTENLKELRKKRALTQQEIADRLGIKLRTYQYYEGGREPELEKLIALADLYDVSLDELVGRERKE